MALPSRRPSLPLFSPFPSGCTTTAVTVEATFPERPIVERLPLAVAVVYDAASKTTPLPKAFPSGAIGRLTLAQPRSPFSAPCYRPSLKRR